MQRRSSVLDTVPADRADAGLRPVRGDAGPPVLGYALQATSDPLAFHRKRYEQYGPVSWFSAFGTRTVLLLGPEATGTALQNRDKAFANGPGWRRLIGPFFDGGLMLRDFDDHLAHRRILQQAFTNDRLRSYLAELHGAIAGGVEQWSPRADFPVYTALKALTLDLASDIFMGGVDFGRRKQEVNQAFIGCVQAATSLVRLPLPGTRWRRGLRGRALLEQVLRPQVARRRAEDSAGEDLFSQLCTASDDDGARFTDDEVVDHMVFLLMAAHDTSTITATSMVSFLGRHPEWQQRCRAEADGLSSDNPSREELDGLEALDLVMKESLRLVTPVPSLMRQTVAETEVCGHHLPAGTPVAVASHQVHHDPQVWTEPARFDPDRFAEPRREDRNHRFAWQPFGGGVHKCIGMYFGTMEVKAIMTQLLRRFTWTVDPAYEMPLNYNSLPFPTDGAPVALRRRERASTPA
ncbi:cytochrome P450 [Saccharopolyspora sp. HNM0986]|uniref:cytochrome P450 n=1 Tax=Saccharopolyspora galaxeae TaxID=2781241 RepID=UPI00190A9D75|nr:cytochrome P450 [Saccharopolyspora sp. HNM0986]MBK0869720.1 cytochrome P450 [Saccharopolyspora sp. HNM0986]